jgi:voltage-gated potassium channel
VSKSRWQYWLETRHIWLLVSLLCLEVVDPISQSVYGGFRVIEGLFALVVLACLFTAAAQRRYLVTAIVLAVPSLASFGSGFGLSISGGTLPEWLVWTRLITMTLLLSFSAVLIVGDALRAKIINVDKICAAVSVYLLLGLIWALFYSMAVLQSPDSIQIPDWPEYGSAEAAGFESFGALTYFSFITLTTVGYGEIIPLTPTTRMLAWLEAVVGQIYVAVLIAKVVAMHVVHKTEK